MNGSVSSPCGGSSGRSFYCDSNSTIYIDGLSDVRAYAKYRSGYNRIYLKVRMADTMAHEYGHHLQNLTGISGDEFDTERTHGSKYVQPYWMNRGFNTRNVALCNTFTATSDKVR